MSFRNSLVLGLICATQIVQIPTAHAGLYSFGGSCTFQGAWTQAALAQSQQVYAAIEALKNNPACKGIESVVANYKMAQQSLEVPNDQKTHADRWESLPSEISALRTFVHSGAPQKAELLKLLVDKNLEMASLATATAPAAATAGVSAGATAAAIANPAAGATAIALSYLAKRTGRAAEDGLNMLNQVLQVLPNYENCLVGNPNQAMAILSGTIKMAASFTSSSEGVMSKTADSMAQMVTMLRDRKFTKIMRQLNQSELWLSMSCMLESITQNYCSVDDAYKIMQANDLNQASIDQDKAKKIDSPLAGYYLLVRELPIISEWIQKLQFGITPRLPPDAQMKNSVWGNITNMVTAINMLNAIYNESLLTLQTISDPSAKKNFVMGLIRKLTLLLVGNAKGIGEAGPEDAGQNFFAMKVMPDLMPFYLIGQNSIPNEVSRTDGQFAVTWDMYMQQGGKYIAEFKDPELLANQIGVRLQSLIQEAEAIASQYFQQRLIVDMPNLINEAVTHPSLTVVESLKRIHNYLESLKRRVLADPNGDLVVIPSINDTQKRIKKTLATFDGMREIAKKYAALDTSDESSEAIDEEIKNNYKKIVQMAYEQFNILLQRDTFLSVRLNTFVRLDYSMRIRSKDNMTEHQREILLVAGKNLLDKLSEAQRVNPAYVKSDLDSAQFVNSRNLQAFENMFGDNMVEAMKELHGIAYGRVHSTGRYFWNNLKENVYYSLLPMGHASMSFEKAKAEYSGSQDNQYKSHEQLLAKMCLQTLSFRNRGRFEPFCRNAILKSTFVSVQQKQTKDTRIQLEAAYGKYITAMGAPANEKQICALRDYGRNNLVFWLTKDLNPQISDSDIK